MGMIWLIAIISPAFLIACLYNGLLRARNRVKSAWSDIDVQLQLWWLAGTYAAANCRKLLNSTSLLSGNNIL